MKVNREIVRLQLLRWCAPPGAGKSYFRPLVCRGNVENVDVFLVHAHPVTPLPPSMPDLYEPFLAKYPLEDFVNRLMDYAAFVEMHRDARQAQGKDLVTVPQQRMNVFVEANPRPQMAVAQTFLNAYPAKDLATLKKEDRKTVERGYDLFFELLQLFRPAWVILLGKPAFDEGAKYFTTHFGLPDFRKRWKDIEVKDPVLEPLTTLKLRGTRCRVAGARSFDKRAISGVPDSDYSDERFLKFCRGAWDTIISP
jgi:hypothetical protein